METILHYSSVVKLIGFALDIPTIIKVLVAGIVMGYLGRVLFTQLDILTPKLGVAINMLTGILFSVVVYVLLLGYLNVIRQNSIARIPLIGRRLALLFPK